MKLNCKQGDLAIVVSSVQGNEGKITRCLELLVTDRITDVHGKTYEYFGGVRPVWRTDRTFTFGSVRPGGYCTEVFYMSDARLRPLRGDLADDETHTTQEKEVASC